MLQIRTVLANSSFVAAVRLYTHTHTHIRFSLGNANRQNLYIAILLYARERGSSAQIACAIRVSLSVCVCVLRRLVTLSLCQGPLSSALVCPQQQHYSLYSLCEKNKNFLRQQSNVITFEEIQCLRCVYVYSIYLWRLYTSYTFILHL